MEHLSAGVLRQFKWPTFIPFTYHSHTIHIPFILRFTMSKQLVPPGSTRFPSFFRFYHGFSTPDTRNFQRTALELSTFLAGDADHGDAEDSDGDSEGFRTPDSGSEVDGFEGLPLGRLPQTAQGGCGEAEDGMGGMDGMDGISNLAPRSVLDEAILGWRETSNKMRESSQICAASFVKAALATIVIFDSFGKLLQSFQADMRKNAKMIQQHVRNDQVSLQDLIDGECKQAGSYAKAIVEGSAAMGVSANSRFSMFQFFLWIPFGLRSWQFQTFPILFMVYLLVLIFVHRLLAA